MNLRLISQCNKSWDFSPLGGLSPHLPLLSWGTELLTGFDQSLEGPGQVVDMKTDHASLLDIFHSCYPQLSLAEIGRLWPLVKNHDEWQTSLSEFGKKYQLRFNRELEVTLEKLSQTPLDFQNWTTAKQMGSRDLAPLRAIKDIGAIQPFLSTLAASALSKSVGAQVLELIVELYLLDYSPDTLMPPKKGDWLAQLKQLRFPQTLQKDRDTQLQLQKLAWPARTVAQWVRQGDKSFLEVKLQVDSEDDLRLKLEGLARVEQSLKGQGLLWKN